MSEFVDGMTSGVVLLNLMVFPDIGDKDVAVGLVDREQGTGERSERRAGDFDCRHRGHR